MVAWQFIAWDVCLFPARPVGDGVNRQSGFVHRVGWQATLVDLIRPSLTGRDSVCPIPGSKLPRYHHLVPPGLKASLITRRKRVMS